MTKTFLRLAAGLALAFAAAAAQAQDLIVEKKTFELPQYTTAGGQTIKGVKVGWEAYGRLNADKSNVILVTHFFSGTSHAAGKYRPEDRAPGYWDWRDGNYVWIDGRYMEGRVGERWVPDRWAEHDGRWRRERGHWDRDDARHEEREEHHRDRDRD